MVASAPRFALGMAALGRPGYINLGHADDLGADRSVAALRRHAFDVLDAAWEAGVRHVDVARSYGRAEEFLGVWLEQRPDRAADVFVSSKWGYTYTAGWRVDAAEHEVKDHSVETLRRQLAATRTHLDGRLDLYQIHSATLATGVLDDPAVLEELARLRDAGVAVGLTTSGTDQADTLRRALQASIDGDNPFGWVQATWNVLETSVGPALAEAAAAGWSVIVKEAVANGRLTTRGAAPGPERVPPPPAALTDVAHAHGVGLDVVALAYVRAQPFVDVVLSGATTVAQLHSNLAARRLELTDADLAALSGLAEAPPVYWARRARLPWN